MDAFPEFVHNVIITCFVVLKYSYFNYILNTNILLTLAQWFVTFIGVIPKSNRLTTELTLSKPQMRKEL
jgi:hypothetical protein